MESDSDSMYIYKYITDLVVVCMRINNFMDYGEASMPRSIDINQSSHQASSIMEIAGAYLLICTYI